jgi:hypothetical protein
MKTAFLALALLTLSAGPAVADNCDSHPKPAPDPKREAAQPTSAEVEPLPR